MHTVDNTIIFEDDSEFQQWAIDSNLKTYRDSNGYLYTTWDFSSEYNKAIREDKEFAIKDRNSRIAINKHVYYRTITKPVQNICTYFSFMDNEE